MSEEGYPNWYYPPSPLIERGIPLTRIVLNELKYSCAALVRDVSANAHKAARAAQWPLKSTETAETSKPSAVTHLSNPSTERTLEIASSNRWSQLRAQMADPDNFPLVTPSSVGQRFSHDFGMAVGGVGQFPNTPSPMRANFPNRMSKQSVKPAGEYDWTQMEPGEDKDGYPFEGFSLDQSGPPQSGLHMGAEVSASTTRTNTTKLFTRPISYGTEASSPQHSHNGSIGQGGDHAKTRAEALMTGGPGPSRPSSMSMGKKFQSAHRSSVEGLNLGSSRYDADDALVQRQIRRPKTAIDTIYDTEALKSFEGLGGDGPPPNSILSTWQTKQPLQSPPVPKSPPRKSGFTARASMHVTSLLRSKSLRNKSVERSKSSRQKRRQSIIGGGEVESEKAAKEAERAETMRRLVESKMSMGAIAVRGPVVVGGVRDNRKSTAIVSHQGKTSASAMSKRTQVMEKEQQKREKELAELGEKQQKAEEQEAKDKELDMIKEHEWAAWVKRKEEANQAKFTQLKTNANNAIVGEAITSPNAETFSVPYPQQAGPAPEVGEKLPEKLAPESKLGGFARKIGIVSMAFGKKKDKKDIREVKTPTAFQQFVEAEKHRDATPGEYILPPNSYRRSAAASIRSEYYPYY
jgi:hypothetical protein